MSLKHSRDFILSLESYQNISGLFVIHILSYGTRFLHERTVSCSITIFFSFQSAGRLRRLPPSNFARIRNNNLPVHLGHNGTSNGSRVSLQLLKSYKYVSGHEELCRFQSVRIFLDSHTNLYR